MKTKSSLRLRDRDAVISKEGIIFRVYGYFHPPDGYVCDVEYAPSEIYTSSNPRAQRKKGSKTFYKFYSDEGLRFVLQHHPEYTVFCEPLQRKLVGIPHHLIADIRKPELRLRELVREDSSDELVASLQSLIGILTDRSGLSRRDFGVFGSLLHGFHHPRLSDIDLIVYGRSQVLRLRGILAQMYADIDSPLSNEFESEKSLEGKRWGFLNYSAKEFLRHQRRKMIYAVFDAPTRRIKVEFEPVKAWSEISNEYDPKTRIVSEGWIKARARITDDVDAPFMPSVYQAETLEIIHGSKIEDITRVVSYVDEFRIQAFRDETIYVEGNLERVDTPRESYHQITLSYGPRYYEQVLKSLSIEE